MWAKVSFGSNRAATSSSPTLPGIAAPRLSIVVLPFANLSNDPEQRYFADGITEDVTTDQSRLAERLSDAGSLPGRPLAVVSKKVVHLIRHRPLREGA
jgi:hypothetical protein